MLSLTNNKANETKLKSVKPKIQKTVAKNVLSFGLEINFTNFSTFSLDAAKDSAETTIRPVWKVH